MLTADGVTASARRSFSSIQFGHEGRIGLAVSGGSDSTALLLLARDILTESGRAGRLLCVTVDHGLRPESAGEAQRVAGLCVRLGVAHRTMRWDGPKPATGLQNAAREARYRLLSRAVGEAGGTIVLTGHSLDDQFETVAMRTARGAGRGLSGMAPATLYERRTWFVRPLIELRRSDLRNYLADRGQDWIDDPSNSNAAFERVRIRRDGAAPPDPAGFREAFEARTAEARTAASILRDEAAWQFDTAARTAMLRSGAIAGKEGFALALAVVLAWVGQCRHLAPAPVIGKAVAFCAEAPNGKRITASGCLLSKSNGMISIAREQRNRRTGEFGFDHILPSPDFALAAALNERTEGAFYPPSPISGYPV